MHHAPPSGAIIDVFTNSFRKPAIAEVIADDLTPYLFAIESSDSAFTTFYALHFLFPYQPDGSKELYDTALKKCITYIKTKPIHGLTVELPPLLWLLIFLEVWSQRNRHAVDEFYSHLPDEKREKILVRLADFARHRQKGHKFMSLINPDDIQAAEKWLSLRIGINPGSNSDARKRKLIDDLVAQFKLG